MVSTSAPARCRWYPPKEEPRRQRRRMPETTTSPTRLNTPTTSLAACGWCFKPSTGMCSAAEVTTSEGGHAQIHTGACPHNENLPETCPLARRTPGNFRARIVQPDHCEEPDMTPNQSPGAPMSPPACANRARREQRPHNNEGCPGSMHRPQHRNTNNISTVRAGCFDRANNMPKKGEMWTPRRKRQPIYNFPPLLR